MKATIDLYTTTLAYAFSHSFGIMRDTTQGNGLVCGTLPSVSFRLAAINDTNIVEPVGTIRPRYKTYDNDVCSCHDSATCKEEAYVYTPDNTKVRVHRVSGLVIGCYGFEAMMQSSLLCYFYQTCIDDLRAAIHFSDNFTTSALDPSKLLYFDGNSTVEMMVEKLMIEQSTNNISYTNYYHQCYPVYC
ncbi:unnamed protein product [Rotaria socialis]|uniref:Uncharacterized protein n=1 Tax=Rotaria socialis TaxID=392032 RepID=A0A818AJQ0_9BILA|nr:unnamed protein product [Rotaria socialis]CAF4489575.1 unnamed protein product [Rotaria socialis]